MTSAPDGLTAYERFVWRGLISGARAWREAPSERRALAVQKMARLAFKTPAPRPMRDEAMMRVIFNGQRVAKDFVGGDRVDAWPSIDVMCTALEGALTPDAPAPEPSPYYLRD